MGWFVCIKYPWIPMLWVALFGIAMLTTMLMYIYKYFYNTKTYLISKMVQPKRN
jgi:hypothetical protein